MIGLVTQQARDAVAEAEALKGRRYREVPDGEGGTRLVPARLGTAPGLAAYDDADAEDETEDKGENGAFKGMAPGVISDAVRAHESNPGATAIVTGSNGAAEISRNMLHHDGGPMQLYPQQHPAAMPTALADLSTTEAPAPAGPTFEPGTASVQAQNHRAPTHAFPQAHVPGQVPFHTAPINTGGQR
jgi:hypothetical protein